MSSSLRLAPAQSLKDLKLNDKDIAARIAATITRHSAPPLYTRHWLTHSHTHSHTHSFRVMQFNLLAEGLSAHPDAPPPFQQDTRGNPITASTCGGFDHDHDCHTHSLSHSLLIFDFHDYRKWRLLEEILLVDPDVLAVEEIDHFADFFEPVLASYGYKGIFQPKKDSPCTQFGYYSDGVAVFWKEAVFSDSDLTPICTNELSPCVVVPLLHRATEKKVVFAATHLKSKPLEVNEIRREGQISAVMDTMDECFNSCQGDAMMLLGDFNTDAFSVGGLQARVIPSVLNWKGGILSHTYPLPTHSSCDIYSTWKIRSGKTAKHLIDYMFYTHNSLRVSAILGPPSGEEIAESKYKLPDLRYPSDHISIAADMVINV